ncbi:hypothetical protein FAGAP_8243, partial [Fusarium agapanthi]
MEYTTVPWSSLDFIRELWPTITARYDTKQCKGFLAEFGIASVDGVDAKGGSKSDSKSDNKFDTTGFLHDNSVAYYETSDGYTDIVFQPLFKEASFGHWVQMEVKITESESKVPKYYPLGEVWIGDGKKDKPKNPYQLSNHFSSPRTSEFAPSYNSSISVTGLNPDSSQTTKPMLTNTNPLKRARSSFDMASAPSHPNVNPLKRVRCDVGMASAPGLPRPQNWHNSSSSITGLNVNYCQSITKPLEERTYNFDIALAPALPYPQIWGKGQRYSVVINTVFEELERKKVVLRNACHSLPADKFRCRGEYSWVPPNERLWYVPGSESEIETAAGCTLAYAGNFLSLRRSLLMHQSPTSCTNEARCVTSMISYTGTPEILGYNKGFDYDMWVAFDGIDYDVGADLGGFPTKIIDQYG